MASRGQGRKGCPRGDSQPSPVFYQQAFMKAIGTAFTSIAQASVVVGQGGSNNL